MSFAKAEGRAAEARLVGSDGLIGVVRAVVAAAEEAETAVTQDDVRLLRSAIENGDVTVIELDALVRTRKALRASFEAGGIQDEQDSVRKIALAPLRSLLKGVAWPVEAEPPVNPELEKRREFLRGRQAAREYAAKVKNIPRGTMMTLDPTDLERRRRQGLGPITEARIVVKELSLGFMMILLCAGVFFAFKQLAESLGKSKSTSLIWGLCGGIAMLFIEMILFVIRNTRLEGFERKRAKFIEKESMYNLSDRPLPQRNRKTR